MKIWFQKNYKTIIISAFLVPIITVAIVSISHVTRWYGISNPNVWAVYLSIGIEIAALSSLAAISVNMGKKVYFPFIIVTLIQFIGNVFFSYSFIDITSTMFKSWVELVSPLLNLFGVDPTDIAGHKRFLAFFAGGMLPVISLSFLHMLIKFTEDQNNKEINSIVPNVEVNNPIEELKEQEIPAKDIVAEVSRVRLTEEELSELERMLNKRSENETKPSEERIQFNSYPPITRPATTLPYDWPPLIKEKESVPENSDKPLITETLSQEPMYVPDEESNVDVDPVIQEKKFNADDPIADIIHEEVTNPIPPIDEKEVIIDNTVPEIVVDSIPAIEEDEVIINEPIVTPEVMDNPIPAIEEKEVIVNEPAIVSEIKEIKPEIFETQILYDPVDEKKKQ